MEKINIAKILKDCPKGMELDCLMYDNMTLMEVDDKDAIYPIKLLRSDGWEIELTKYGQYVDMDDAKCVIFPKGKTTWEGFIPPCKFKDGDVIYVEGFRKWVAIVKSCDDNAIYEHVALQDKATLHFSNNIPLVRFSENPTKIRFATEEQRDLLFQKMKEAGYKWNPENKTLEKLIESNEDVDDKIVMSGIYFDRENYADEVELHLGNYEIEIRDSKTYAVFKNQKNKTLKKLKQPKFKIGAKIQDKSGCKAKIIEVREDKEFYIYESRKGIGRFSFTDQNDWELIPNKFDISTLKPFDKVLVRCLTSSLWRCAFYSHYVKDEMYPYKVCPNIEYKQCIPYEGNEHLRGTANDCDDFYKTWV